MRGVTTSPTTVTFEASYFKVVRTVSVPVNPWLFDTRTAKLLGSNFTLQISGNMDKFQAFGKNITFVLKRSPFKPDI